MSDYLEFENETKALKSINLDDFSVEDLKEYVDSYLSEKIHGTIIGASIKKTYWEKRFYFTRIILINFF